jgi:hypothetical protein
MRCTTRGSFRLTVFYPRDFALPVSPDRFSESTFAATFSGHAVPFILGNSEFLVGGQKTKSENEAGQRRPGIVVFWIQGLSSGGFTQKLG